MSSDMRSVPDPKTIYTIACKDEND